MTYSLYAQNPSQERWLTGTIVVLAVAVRLLGAQSGAWAWEPDPITLGIGVFGAFLVSGALAVWLRR